jgi:hypothetical protein
MNNSKKDSVHIVSNDAVRGKPYLDIDRVITEGKSNSSDFNKRK